MKMNKKIMYIGISVLIIGILIGSYFIFHNFSSEDELHVYYWWNYFGEDVLSEFENSSNVDVNFYPFENEYEMFQEIESGPLNYDIIGVTDNFFNKMVNRNLLFRVDNYNVDDLNENCIQESIEDVEEYGVPYVWGVTGLVINTKYIQEDVDSWGVLWNPEYSGKIMLLDNAEELVGMASLYLGFDLVPQTEEKINEVYNILLEQNSLVLEYAYEDLMIDDLVSEKVWVAQVYGGTAREAMMGNKDLKFIIPKEGALKWVDYLTIGSDSGNKDIAKKFISYVYQPEVSARIMNDTRYFLCNAKAYPFVDGKLLDEISFYDSEDVRGRLFSYLDYDQGEEFRNLEKQVQNKIIGSKDEHL